MNRLVNAALAAAAASLASWAVSRLLERSAAPRARAARAIQVWENEGGSLAPPSWADGEDRR
jgi:hypothetical protein